MNISWISLFIMLLTTWRLSSMLANEGGPFNMFYWIRTKMGCRKDCETKSGSFAAGVLCEWCNSVWIGTILTVGYYFFGTKILWFCTPFALSAFTILMKYVVQTKQIKQELFEREKNDN